MQHSVRALPAEPNSLGRRFDTRRVLGFFLLFVSLSSVLNQVPQGGATQLIFFHKIRCLAVLLGAQIWQKSIVHC